MRGARSGRNQAVSPRTITRNSTATPVTTYVHHIHGRAVSVPAKTPCTIESVKVGTANRWVRRHHFVPIFLRSHDATITNTIAYIPTIPNATGIGLNGLCIGTSSCFGPKGMN